MSKRGHLPVRTCIGCRMKRKKEEMIWLTQGPEGAAVVDKKKSHQGRGFYLCPDLRCLDRAKKKRKEDRFLQAVGFQFPFAEGFSKEGKRVGIEEVGNDKK